MRWASSPVAIAGSPRAGMPWPATILLRRSNSTPSWPELISAAAWQCTIAGDNKTAILDFDEALKLDSEYQKAFYFRGNAKLNTGQDEEAIEDFTQSIRLNPKSAGAYNGRGCAQFKLKKFEDSESDFARAIELLPSFKLYWKNRSDAREKLGKVSEAIGDLEKAIEFSRVTRTCM